MVNPVYTAPPDSGMATLGKTLPSLMYESCAKFTNSQALNQPAESGWQAFSLEEFCRMSEEAALGFRQSGFERGDRVAFFMESDVYFCIADMACLIAGLVDVPIYLTHAPETIQFVAAHAEARGFVVSTGEQLKSLAPLLKRLPRITTVVVAEPGVVAQNVEDLPSTVTLLSLDDLRERGRLQLSEKPDAVRSLVSELSPHDLATIIYTSGTTGQPKGVMLSHENISYNAMTSFSGLTGYREGHDGEVAVSFLPMTHIFARTLHYGYLGYGTSVYFTTPENLGRDLKAVRPTVFATVPRVLEKVYSRIRERAATLSGLAQTLLKWSLRLAQQYSVGETMPLFYRLQWIIANVLVFRKWREALGGRVRFVISGGAALGEELTNLFGAAGINILQGYGLTETSPVITYNRPLRNRAGTVGEPLPGVEVRIAEDGEILTRGPHVMQGYYKDEALTRQVIDKDGWMHTGDIGAFTPDGHLKITDRKKDLFKLSTGKYVVPQPLESRLVTEPLVEQAFVVGIGHKFCAALIFPDHDVLRTFAGTRGMLPNLSVEQLIEQPEVVARYQELVDKANEGMDEWSTIKRFKLIPEHVTIESGLLTPTMKLKRSTLRERYKELIETLYADTEQETPSAGRTAPQKTTA